MLELSTKPDGKLSLRATLINPVIYLDHWAIIDFSNQAEKKEKFISLLKQKNGTVLMSQTNFFEAAGFDNIEQAERIENFLEEVLPNVHIVDFSLDTAMFGNTSHLYEKQPLDKFWIINFLLELAQINKGKLTFKTMFTGITKEHSLFKPLFLELKDQVAKSVYIAIHSEEMRLKASGYKPDSRQPAMNLMLSAYLYTAQQNINQKFELNDSIDLIHAIPAVLTSDFALLDKKWCHRTDRAKEYLTKNGVNLKMATCHWGSDEELERFFTELNSYTATISNLPTPLVQP